MSDVDVARLKAFIPRLFSQMFIEMLVYGNITKSVSRLSLYQCVSVWFHLSLMSSSPADIMMVMLMLVSCAMAVRPTRSLRCYGCNHVGVFLSPSFLCECSSCSLDCSFQEGSQILWSPSFILITENCCQDTGTDQWVSLRELGRSISSKFQE